MVGCFINQFWLYWKIPNVIVIVNMNDFRWTIIVSDGSVLFDFDKFSYDNNLITVDLIDEHIALSNVTKFLIKITLSAN